MRLAGPLFADLVEHGIAHPVVDGRLSPSCTSGRDLDLLRKRPRFDFPVKGRTAQARQIEHGVEHAATSQDFLRSPGPGQRGESRFDEIFNALTPSQRAAVVAVLDVFAATESGQPADAALEASQRWKSRISTAS